MYKIAICDDDQNYLQSTAKLVSQITADNKIEATVKTYSDGNSLISDLNSDGQSFNLILFDVMLGSENGINLACELRKHNLDIGIIFITTSPDFLIDGYEAEPSGYVLKPIDKAKLEQAVMRAFTRFSHNNILIKDNDKSVSVCIDDITYIDVYGKTLTIHLASNKTISFKKSLGEIINILPQKNFIQCHRSFIVAVSSIVSIKRYELGLSDNQIIPVSKRCYATVQTALIQNGAAKL